ncbi:MAG: glycosyltransferase family 4 protein [Planctomycetota bacterium]|jgi:glycosyltransferase involved in cell wall biosynthesis
MKVLMLGWEFPPFISGGLGTACYGLTKAMSESGAEVLFLLPKPVASSYSTHVKMVSPKGQLGSGSVYRLEEFENVTFRTLEAGGGISPYLKPEQYSELVVNQESELKQSQALESAGIYTPVDNPHTPTEAFIDARGAHYHGDMFDEIARYARLATQVAAGEDFDVVHAHDWMTYRAGIAVSALTGKPLVVHVHSTEFDRSGEHVNQRIYDIERQGMHAASQVIAVSYLTKNIVASRYGVPGDRVHVVYNAIDFNGYEPPGEMSDIGRDEKLVLFLGRITMQKGPEYFLGAAKKVLEVVDNVRFVMAGSGDMIRGTIEMAAEMGIGHKVLFTGFLRGRDVERVFRMADLYVMPSVSEPFGIAPLEALSHDVPAIISKQSGVSEVLTHVLKVDFWDVNEIANKIIAVLRHPSLQKTLREYGKFEVRKLSWSDSARRCLDIYQQAIGSMRLAAV